MRLSFALVLIVFATFSALPMAPSASFAQDAPKGEVTKAEDQVYLPEPPPTPEPSVTQEGPLKEEYEPGKVRLERMVRKMSDDTIVNHGKYTEYYKNGNKFAEGAYDNGVHEGSWSFWHENGKLSKTVNFKNGQPDGAWEVFRADETLMGKRGYKSGLREGTWVVYGKDGKTPLMEQTYVDGKLHGQATVYFEDGKPRVQSTFKDGLREGKVTEWDATGRKIAEADYVAGKLDGKLVRYAPDGATSVEYYKAGARVQPGAATP